MKTNVIVLLSGGIDSATALYWALKQGYMVQAVTYNYQGRPSKEIKAALKIARYTGVKCLVAELPFMQTAIDIMRENPASFKGIEVPEGYIPMRNFIFYALGAYYAEIYGASDIIGGHLESDSISFPDATPSFFSAVEQLVNNAKLSNVSRTSLIMPFLQKTKSDVLRMAVELGVPLGLTRSCYYDGEEQCGECVSCLERGEAFARNGLTDPLMQKRP